MSTSEERSARRRFIFGAPDALRESILDSIDRVEADRSAADAARDLLALVEIHAEAFTSELIAQLVSDTAEAKRESMLEALRMLSAVRGEPSTSELLELARAAMVDYWGREASARIFAEFGSASIFDDVELLHVLIDVAGPVLERIGFNTVQPMPAPLLKLYALSPEQLLRVLRADLALPRGRRRMRAALAARVLMENHPAIAKDLAKPLIDTLLWAQSHEEEEGKDAIQAVVGDAIFLAPTEIEPLADEAWESSDERGKLAILLAFDDACRHRTLQQLSDATATAIARRALLALNEDDPELLDRGGDTLEQVCGYFPNAVKVPFLDLFRPLARLCEPPSGERQIDLNDLALVPYLDLACTHLASAIIRLGWTLPQEFWQACQEAWGWVSGNSVLRLHLTRITATLAKHRDLTAEALPLLEDLLQSGDVRVKSVILRNLADQDWPEDVQAPASFEAMVIACVMGSDWEAAEPAVEAIRKVHVPDEQRDEVAMRLVAWANGIAPYRRLVRMVEQAIDSALWLARGAALRERVMAWAVAAVRRMDRLDGAKTLRWRPELRSHPDWVPAVIAFLCAHEDRRYWDLSEKYREQMARDLLSLGREVVSPYVGELIASAKAATNYDRKWAWYIADVVSYLGFFDEAEGIALAAWEATGDEDWFPLKKEDATEALWSFKFEAAVARGDMAAAKAIAARWRPALEKAKKLEEERARIFALALSLAD